MLFFRALAPAILLSLSLAACSADRDEPAPAPLAPAASSVVDEVVASHVAVVRRRVAANNAKDWGAWEALHTDGAVRTAPELPEPLRGAKAMRAGIEELVQTFPDYHLELVDAFGAGDRLVARIHTKATMLGAMPFGEGTVPPTGKVFEQDWVAVLRFEGDRIASIDEFHDNYGVLLQLGLAGGQ
jgi:ketosteroid isomerase-like protein